MTCCNASWWFSVSGFSKIAAAETQKKAEKIDRYQSENAEKSQVTFFKKLFEHPISYTFTAM